MSDYREGNFERSLLRVQYRYRQRLLEAVQDAASNTEKSAAVAALNSWDREHPELLPYFGLPAEPRPPPEPRPGRRLEDLQYGDAALDDVSAIDPISLDLVDPDRAVYLQPNVSGGRATALYDYGQLDTLLARRQARSPMTRRPFTASNIMRAPRGEVEQLVARAARLSYFA